jgi:hypothetical protein
MKTLLGTVLVATAAVAFGVGACSSGGSGEGGSPWYQRRPVTGPHGRTVATFTPTVTPDPADLWEPFTRVTGMTSDGSQGAPYGSYRPGSSIEHEPVDRAERMAQATAQTAARNAAKDQDDGAPHLGGRPHDPGSPAGHLGRAAPVTAFVHDVHRGPQHGLALVVVFDSRDLGNRV